MPSRVGATVVRVQVDDQGHSVGVDLTLARVVGARMHPGPVCSLPDDVRAALLDWLQLPDVGRST